MSHIEFIPDYATPMHLITYKVSSLHFFILPLSYVRAFHHILAYRPRWRPGQIAERFTEHLSSLDLEVHPSAIFMYHYILIFTR